MEKVIVIVILLQIIGFVFSCKCLPTLSIKYEFLTSNAVFLGKVVQIQQKIGTDKIILFYIFNSWKGIW
jgi:hypothetical protein